MIRKSVKSVLIVFLTIVTIIPAFSVVYQAAPPPSEKTQYFYADGAVYVSEEAANTNFDSGVQSYNLRVGEGAEFLYDYLSFVKFSSLELPEDAEIVEAEIGLYLTSASTSASVKMFYVREFWIEDFVTWNDKPVYKVWSSKYSRYLGLIDEVTVSTTTGWKYFDATSLVEDWVDGSKYNDGVCFESLEGHDFVFASDDSSYYKPRLRVTYVSSGGSSESPPEDPPEDTTPCSIEYSVSPAEPMSGDNVTISVTASDDTAMEYVSIHKGGVEVSLCEAVGTQTSLSCSYSEVLYAGTHGFSVFADDKGSSAVQGETFWVNVTGSGTSPVVSLDVEFRDMNAIPEKYRLLPGDNQMINVTISASDPEGIDFMTFDSSISIPEDVSFDPPVTEVVHKFSVLNDDVSDRSFSCYVRVYDVEDESTRVDSEDFEIGVPYQWYWGLPFDNWGVSDNDTWSWEMMEFIFGEDEVWIEKDWDWKRPRAQHLFEEKIETGGRNGQCYGMCALSLELADPHSDLYANYLESSAVSIDNLSAMEWNYTWRYYFARQMGQYCYQVQDVKADQFWAQEEEESVRSSGLQPHLDDILDDIIDDLESDIPGILGIHGSGGHAVVPWRVVPGVGDNPTKVFVYDPNREFASTYDSIDYGNIWKYPYVEVGVDSRYEGWWSYTWNSTSDWDENIYYFPFDLVMGNPGKLNYLGSVGISDQSLPSSTQISAMGMGDVGFYAIDSSGRKSGIINGSVVAEIPGSFPVEEYAGASSSQWWMYPSDVELEFHLVGSVENGLGVYGLSLWDESGFYELSNASCEKGSEDILVVSPSQSSSQQDGYALRFIRDDLVGLRASDPLDFSLKFGKEVSLRGSEAYREYVFSASAAKDSDVEVSVSGDRDSLVVESFGSALDFSVLTRSSESLLENPNLEFIPKSFGQFSLGQFEKTSLSPESWQTDEVSGAFSSSDELQPESSDDQVPGFEVAVLVAAIFICLVFLKKKE